MQGESGQNVYMFAVLPFPNWRTPTSGALSPPTPPGRLVPVDPTTTVGPGRVRSPEDGLIKPRVRARTNPGSGDQRPRALNRLPVPDRCPRCPGPEPPSPGSEASPGAL